MGQGSVDKLNKHPITRHLLGRLTRLGYSVTLQVTTT
jgi:hypothetical protein